MSVSWGTLWPVFLLLGQVQSLLWGAVLCCRGKGRWSGQDDTLLLCVISMAFERPNLGNVHEMGVNYTW